MSSSSSFNWSSFLDFANSLAQKSEASEAALRSAISRAYYAAYHGARQLLMDMNKEIPRRDKESSHSAVWRICKKDCGLSVRPIGTAGRNLQDDRERADYKNPFPENLHKKTKQVLESAKYIVKETNRISLLSRQPK